ncbi:hypothetical protein BC830DRAFT_86750 [Chytriomyces sp. MP71]|nr:hypothetical protein BC830DRAFT_86750 [Chytriomyces sp. MP71]
MINKILFKRINRGLTIMYFITLAYCVMVQFLSPGVAIFPVMNFVCTFDFLQFGFVGFTVLIIMICGGIFCTWLLHDINDTNFVANDCLATYGLCIPCG